MAPHADSQREHHRPIPNEDLPLRRYEPNVHATAQHDHHDDDKQADDDGEPEAAQDLGDLDEEVGALDFFFSRAPSDVVGDAVRDEGLGEVHGEAAEEEEAKGERGGGGVSEDEEMTKGRGKLTRTGSMLYFQSRCPANSSCPAYILEA